MFKASEETLHNNRSAAASSFLQPKCVRGDLYKYYGGGLICNTWSPGSTTRAYVTGRNGRSKATTRRWMNVRPGYNTVRITNDIDSECPVYCTRAIYTQNEYTKHFSCRSISIILKKSNLY